jgi:hypothetical protein
MMLIMFMQGTVTREIQLGPYLLTPHFFASRMRGVSIEVSQEIFARLQAIDVIDKDGLCIWYKCEKCW